jgi:hypothetical protein
MTTGRLRAVGPDEQPAPRVDDDSAAITAEAVDALAAPHSASTRN